MDMLHLSTTQQSDGIFDVCIDIDGKRYTYAVTSEYANRMFIFFYMNHYYGKAINLLKKFTREV